MPNTLASLSPLLEPQERLDRLFARAFRRFGPRLADLSYANPYDGPPAQVLHVLQRVTRECTGLSLQYTPYGGRVATRRAIAAALARRYGLAFDSRDIVLTSGAMSALNVGARALFARGDEVIVLTPAWQDYPLYLENLNIRVRFVALRPDKHMDLEAIAEAIGPRTRGVLFSQPCCPTGVVYSEEELRGLAGVLFDAEARLGTEIYIVSDEVHRDLVWGGRPFYSPLHVWPRSLSIYSFGKALSLQGQRIGYVAVSPRMPSNEDVRLALERCVRLMGYGHPSSLMQYAVCDLLDHEPPLETLSVRQTAVRRALTAYGYETCEGDATFYVYVRSPIPDDFAFAELLASRGVLVVPSTLFHDAGYFRLSLTARHEAIAAALAVIEQALTDVAAGATHATTCSSTC